MCSYLFAPEASRGTERLHRTSQNQDPCRQDSLIAITYRVRDCRREPHPRKCSRPKFCRKERRTHPLRALRKWSSGARRNIAQACFCSNYQSFSQRRSSSRAVMSSLFSSCVGEDTYPPHFVYKHYRFLYGCVDTACREGSQGSYSL